VIRVLKPPNPSGIATRRKDRCNLPMNSTKSREVILSGRIMAAKISAEQARERAVAAVREADRAEHAWSLRMEG
jgi:hypothetical protein